MVLFQSLLPFILTIVAMASTGFGSGSPNLSPNESPDVLPRRASCPDERFRPCGSMCCTPHEHCSYLDMIGYSCFENEGESYTSTMKTRTATTARTTSTGSSSQPKSTATQPPAVPAPNLASHGGRSGGGKEMVLLGLVICFAPVVGLL